tara:strand:- start:634 stop:780 length:147 start_codon:yes stop_codon:yes gene_type:complete
MSFYKHNKFQSNSIKKTHADLRKSKRDVVDRFLSVLWRREVELKLTAK